MLKAYENGDVSAVLLELCNRSMFDLLKEAYLIPKRFHGKTGENPVLLTDINGKVLNTKQSVVSRHEYKKFLEIYQRMWQLHVRNYIWQTDMIWSGTIRNI
mgnify:CR=1 FL=1